MKQNDTYRDLDGKSISLGNLDGEERRLVDRLRRRARLKADWNDFDNFCYRAVGEFYDARGVPRSRHERAGRPIGNDLFLGRLENRVGRVLRALKPGPKPLAQVE